MPTGVPPGVTVKLTGRYAQLLNGKIDVREMDDEELSRLQLRDKNGKFTGSTPRALPRELIVQVRQEIHRRAELMFNGALQESIGVLMSIAQDTFAKDSDRIKAAGMIIDRAMGKTPERVEISASEKPWQIVLGRIEDDLRSLPSGAPVVPLEDLGNVDIVEGEVM